MGRCDRHRHRGFVLVVVLWMLVALAVGAALVVAWSRERVSEATRQRDALQDHLDAIGTRDTLLFIASTVPMTRAGLPVEPSTPAELAARRLDEFGGLDKAPRGGELRLDGTVYAGLGAIRLQLQDEAGLVPVAATSGAVADALLAAARVSRARRAILLAALEDYTDPDDLRRLNGAESKQYESAGRPPPPGRPIATPREVWQVLGWDALPPPTQARLEDVLTASYAGALNLNSAPGALLAALMPDCGRACRQRIDRREGAVFESGAQFEVETGARLPGDRDVDFRVAPSDVLRMTLTGRSGRAWRMHVRLTPLADRAGPWTVEAAYRVSRPLTDDAPRPIPSPLLAPPPME